MNFRTWVIAEEEKANSIQQFIDSNGLILFFKKGSDFYGTGEDGRMAFARIKNPDEEMPDGWEDEASFIAVNLSKTAEGEPSQHVFNKKDLKSIKVVDSNKVIQQLASKDKESDCPTLNVIRIQTPPFDIHRDKAPNFSRTDEE